MKLTVYTATIEFLPRIDPEMVESVVFKLLVSMCVSGIECVSSLPCAIWELMSSVHDRVAKTRKT